MRGKPFGNNVEALQNVAIDTDNSYGGTNRVRFQGYYLSGHYL